MNEEAINSNENRKHDIHLAIEWFTSNGISIDVDESGQPVVRSESIWGRKILDEEGLLAIYARTIFRNSSGVQTIYATSHTNPSPSLINTLIENVEKSIVNGREKHEDRP